MTGEALRTELFVRHLDASIAWYQAMLAFVVARREPGYASLRRGQVVLGLGSVANLPPDHHSADRLGHTQASVSRGAGAGVELVLELERAADVDDAAAHIVAAGWRLAAAVMDRPWGLRDFRVLDPDGYYWRITHAA